MRFKNQNIQKLVLSGTVYPANYIDTDKETITKEDLSYAKNHYDALVRKDAKRVDVNHDFKATDSVVTKSWEEVNSDGTFLWKMECEVTSPDLIRKVLNGELNGYSLGAKSCAGKELKSTKVEYNESVVAKAEGETHSHLAYVEFNSSGKVIGGYTNKAKDGHYHVLKAGTMTDETVGGTPHTHRLIFDEIS